MNVTDEDIENELQPYIRRATRLVSVDREAHMGDTAVIDFEGFDDGKPFEGGKGEDYSLEIGSGSFVPGFEDQVIGMKAGEEKDLDITFPEDYHADLAGKAVVFHVKVKEVKEPQAPEVDDEFAKDVSEFETLADFRKDLGEKLQPAPQQQAQTDFENAVLEQLVDNMECEIPDGMVETQLDKLMDDYAMRMQSQGISMDDYLKMMGANAEMLRASARPSALRQVQMELALEAVAEAENLEVTEEECEAEISRWPSSTSMPAEQVKAAVPVEALKQDLLLQKATELVVDEAKVGEAPKKEEAAPRRSPRRPPQEEDRGGRRRGAARRGEAQAHPEEEAEESAEEPKAE